jgi:hypothetical protein
MAAVGQLDRDRFADAGACPRDQYREFAGHLILLLSHWVQTETRAA